MTKISFQQWASTQFIRDELLIQHLAGKPCNKRERAPWDTYLAAADILEKAGL